MKKVYAHYRVNRIGELHHAGGVTMYGEWDPDTGVLVAMGAACTMEDNYNYKRGRLIAEGRFKKYQFQQGSADIGSINVPQHYKALTGEEVHTALGWIAAEIGNKYIKPTEGGLSLRRYYRSVGEFEK